MASEPRKCSAVEEMIGLVESKVFDNYELLLCDPCKDDQHKDCTKLKSKLHTAGYEILGSCQCDHPAHRIQPKPKGKVDEPNSGS